jgi:hypothetical protein
MMRGDQLLEYAEEAQDERDAIRRDIRAVRDKAVPDAKVTGKEHMLALLRRDPNYKWVETDPAYMEHADVRIVRRQACTMKRALREFRSLGDGTNANATVLHIFPNPNPINLVVRLKTDYPDSFIYHSPLGIQFDSAPDANGSRDLIRIVNAVHNRRMELPESDTEDDEA